jgi:hypothetical protein
MAKVDVEGLEPLVIAGGKNFFKSGVTDFVLVETAEWTESRSGVPYSNIYRQLVECGFDQIYIFEGDNVVRVPQSANTPMPVNRNVLFSRTRVGNEAVVTGTHRGQG